MGHTNEPHDHHFTPQGFLKQWANERGEIWRTRVIPYSKKIETVKKFSTDMIAKVKDLYNIKPEYKDSLTIKIAIESIKLRHNFLGEIGLNLESSIFSQVDNDGIIAYNKLLEKEDFRRLSQLEAANLFVFLLASGTKSFSS